MKNRVFALYLPQFHPIPENDAWWGKGFTEWTNVGKAKKFFRGQYQPRVPADLGYYDLRVGETRQAQADMARKYGVEGFVYWHYWFGHGKQLIERIFDEVLSSGEPDFPFALAWANESWRGFAHGLNNRNLLIEQLYPGVDDYTAHFYKLLPAFKDKRYIKIDDKPMFMIYKPLDSPEVKVFIETWRRLASENGLSGIYFVGHLNTPNTPPDQIMSVGVDAVNVVRLSDYISLHRPFVTKAIQKIYRALFCVPMKYKYKTASRCFVNKDIDKQENIFPSIIPGWDHTPRSGKQGLIYDNSTPELFEHHVKDVVDVVSTKPDNRQIIFIKSWNEWAEGNYMEPDMRWGTQYLEALSRQIK